MVARKIPILHVILIYLVFQAHVSPYQEFWFPPWRFQLDVFLISRARFDCAKTPLTPCIKFPIVRKVQKNVKNFDSSWLSNSVVTLTTSLIFLHERDNKKFLTLMELFGAKFFSFDPCVRFLTVWNIQKTLIVLFIILFKLRVLRQLQVCFFAWNAPTKPFTCIVELLSKSITLKLSRLYYSKNTKKRNQYCFILTFTKISLCNYWSDFLYGVLYWAL